MVMPKPRVMPCTKPKPSAVTAVAAATPSRTGTAIAASTQGERKRQTSSPLTSRTEATEISRTSSRIAAAASRANTAGPASSSRAGVPADARAKARCTAAIAASWAARSRPVACVRISSSARGALPAAAAANHTPCALRTRLAPVQAAISAGKAPVGSGRPNCCTTGAAEDCSPSSSRVKSRRSAGVSNAAASVAGESR